MGWEVCRLYDEGALESSALSVRSRVRTKYFTKPVKQPPRLAVTPGAETQGDYELGLMCLNSGGSTVRGL